MKGFPPLLLCYLDSFCPVSCSKPLGQLGKHWQAARSLALRRESEGPRGCTAGLLRRPPLCLPFQFSGRHKPGSHTDRFLSLSFVTLVFFSSCPLFGLLKLLSARCGVPISVCGSSRRRSFLLRVFLHIATPSLGPFVSAATPGTGMCRGSLIITKGTTLGKTFSPSLMCNIRETKITKTKCGTERKALHVPSLFSPAVFPVIVAGCLAEP